MGMESWPSKFISVRCFILLLLNATHCFLLVQTQALGQVDECSALLQFKESFAIRKSVSAYPLAYPKVAFWTLEGDQNRSNCCSWDGVECDEDSGHVVGLDLSSSCLYGSLNSSNSLFRLVHLQRLDLSDNHFNFSEIPSRFGQDLLSLTYLNLSNSLFYGQIPSEISILSKLSTLDLSYNSGKLHPDIIPLKLTKGYMRSLVRNLTNIKQLHLSEVDIFSTVPDILVNASSLTSLQLDNCGLNGEFPVGIFHLPNLEVLHVSSNPLLTGYFPTFNRSNFFEKLGVAYTNFSGQLPGSLGNLHALSVLEIAYCQFSPLVPSSLGNLTQLSYLDMSSFFGGTKILYMSSFYVIPNNFSTCQVTDSWSWVGKLTKLYTLSLENTCIKGEFLYFVANLTRLSTLSLGGNNFQGEIPGSLFQLKNLEYLDLSSSNLSGVVEFDQFSKLKKLKVLRLSDNKLSLQSKPDLGATFPQLQVLELISCNLTEFPEILKNQYELSHLDLRNNSIHGRIPKWVWNATRETLFALLLSHNFLTGFDQNPIILPWQNLDSLDLQSNMLHGSLPIPPQSIRNYFVKDNNYSGDISLSFCNLNNLHALDLSNNSLSGMLPKCLGNSSSPEILDLHHNSFHGSIPQICPGENSLKMVDLSYNQLQGKVPRSMANCTHLEFLSLGNNQLSDIFPSWLGALPGLKYLSLRSNGFHGMIGKPATNHEFPKLCITDLSNNGFSGIYVVPYSITTFAKGVELKYDATPYQLRLIDFSSNRFEGEIPAGIIGNLRGVHMLSLSNNALTGHIPSSLGNLTALESLDLSQNQLSGRIPANLAQLNFLAYFNVSHNHLWGPIPLGQQFGTFLEDSYVGNSGLCGKLLSKKCESSRPPPPSIFEEDEDSGFQIELDWYVVLPGIISGLIIGVIFGDIWTNKKHEWFVEAAKRINRRRGRI
ncbi:unnamed protein product [Prunus armeniaca]